MLILAESVMAGLFVTYIAQIGNSLISEEVAITRARIEPLPDHRNGKNTQYSPKDAALGTFSIFFTPSAILIGLPTHPVTQQGAK